MRRLGIGGGSGGWVVGGRERISRTVGGEIKAAGDRGIHLGGAAPFVGHHDTATTPIAASQSRHRLSGRQIRKGYRLVFFSLRLLAGWMSIFSGQALPLWSIPTSIPFPAGRSSNTRPEEGDGSREGIP